MKQIKISDWLKAAVKRAVRTFAQTAVATIGVAALMSDVSWVEVLSASLLSAILSILMSIGGLPEAKDSESFGNFGR